MTTTTEPEVATDNASALQSELDRHVNGERDLSPRLDVEAREGTSDAAFRRMVEGVRDYAIFLLDPNGRIATWNAGAERFTGYAAHEIIGHPCSEFYAAAEIAAGKFELELETAARTGRFEAEAQRVRKDGTPYWVNVILTAIRDQAGALVGFVKVARDVTEQRAADERLRHEEERFGLMIATVRDYALLILDATGHITTWNAGAERIKGYRADEIIGKHFSVFYPEEDVRAGKCEHELSIAAVEGRFEDENWRVRKDGTRFWANVVITALRDPDGTLVGFGKVTRDLTERRKSEEEAAARRAAEQANRTKDEFLAMLGHELRNPLAPILSALQLLKLRGETKSVREHQVIERQVKQMTRLVDDLLDVSRINRGKIELKRASLDLRDVLAKAVEIAIPIFDRKGHQFEVDIPSSPLVVDGDEARLTQVFANLLNNAGKYTDDGGSIALSVRRGGGQFHVEVRDSGVGIDPKLLPRVFELFVQGYQDAERAEGGLGIGLTLVRSLVQLHGGTVEARSAGANTGSTFIVRLPIIDDVVETPTEPRLPRASRSGRSYKVLVVDDNDDARMLLAEVLNTLGHEARSAADGTEALAMIETFAPDVAILDIGLPGMDGYELARRIRALPNQGKIRLLALTGYGQADHIASTREAGFDEHLVKPIEIQRLLAHLQAS